MKEYLRTKKMRILKPSGKPIILRGVNLGGWLMMEGYILHAPNFPEQQFKKNFVKKLGANKLASFEKSFRDNFIAEKDIKQIAGNGFNCVRVPFNYQLVECAPYKYDQKQVQYLDNVIKWCTKNKIYVILDLHAAPGSQNHDWHSDSFGHAKLWTNKANQNRTIAIWEFIAARYKDEKYVAGYDLLNESVIKSTKLLNEFYKQLIKHIRNIDKNHILFIEGNNWATDIECLERFDDDNYVLSIHSYHPIDFTFNLVPHLCYPSKVDHLQYNKKNLKEHLSQYKRIAQKHCVPVLLGEFGVNARDGLFGEDKWLEDMLAICKELGFSWTYWTYKAIKNSAFPDGVYSYYDNPPWVNRLGPVTGWDTYKNHWVKKKNEMTRSWQTENYKSNPSVLKVLKKYAK
ncbi:MAG: hypothetical protein A2Y03_01375 [Omnitrophica WOR_2 bacterium GWF2_38_59]|nr:MAG: hypothetical protein A2Y06_01305 [Omnitrophica WOR_2 bacterium GWA2_37_7]OGX22960.1 MAG: hypothetical protein A2Y03_01375 [Omnitrophica WOR_2 bacterium GWF2_38_59]OGX49729.1 MAG: hypothetical protein A2243_10880 [Omnitrophica WOR_2 bacterium RIFOXYA2_FULL_38_17]OGX52510.1 MAG: hypothetical protein A2267_04995 [Omnitrophica WOR_2 bacterium RIFOXYA12_FULL_38_10]OGX60126.1 MAG: hypothetical protein A2306_08865 [Omnitrophica WOR_2 bacterium RIFOXYB2_FULL_38_16]HBG61443.1 hypothetical prote